MPFVTSEDGVRIHFVYLFRDIGFRRQAQCLGGEGGIRAGIFQGSPERIDKRIRKGRRCTAAQRADAAEHQA